MGYRHWEKLGEEKAGRVQCPMKGGRIECLGGAGMVNDKKRWFGGADGAARSGQRTGKRRGRAKVLTV